MDTYTVEFRMEGLELQPFEITETLGLVPCQTIEANKHINKRYFWCASFQESFDGGVSLSSDLLKKLADFNSELIISNYHGENIKMKGIDL